LMSSVNVPVPVRNRKSSRRGTDFPTYFVEVAGCSDAVVLAICGHRT
jgi:hypothetical protein